MKSTPQLNSQIKVKVCGITHESDALQLDAMGIDYMGFNFWPGTKRYIDPDKAAPIIKKLNHSVPVGIFVDEDLQTLKAVCRDTGILYAQLHGNEQKDYIIQCPVPVIKAVADKDIADTSSLYTDTIAFFLFDTKGADSFGGTGKAFDWHRLSLYRGEVPYFLAGGLGLENIREAITNSSPHAVDLNSRVELAPGKKDIKKIRECLRLINGSIHP